MFPTQPNAQWLCADGHTHRRIVGDHRCTELLADCWPYRYRAFSSPYGQLLIAKLGLFGLMLALAAANRYRLSPLLERVHVSGEHATAIAALRRSLFVETCCAFLILALVAWLGTLGPMTE
jgi:hypothetical protein